MCGPAFTGMTCGTPVLGLFVWSGCDRVKTAVYGCSPVMRPVSLAAFSPLGSPLAARLPPRRRRERQGSLDALPSDFIVAIHALGVDPEEDVHAVSGPFGDLRRRDTGFSQSDTAAWRRSYGRLARGHAYSFSLSAAAQAASQTR